MAIVTLRRDQAQTLLKDLVQIEWSDGSVGFDAYEEARARRLLEHYSFPSSPAAKQIGTNELVVRLQASLLPRNGGSPSEVTVSLDPLEEEKGEGAFDWFSRTIGPILFTGTEIAAGFAWTGPLLEKGVEMFCRGVVGMNLPRRPIQWLPRGRIGWIFAASFLYSAWMFGLKGLPDALYGFTKRNLLEPLESSGLEKGSIPYRFLDGGLLFGYGAYLKERYGNKVLIESQTFGNYTHADPLNWFCDFASNVLIFCPLIASALAAPRLPFMDAGFWVYWSPIIGTARMTSVWGDDESKEMHVSIGRGAIFLGANSALALTANSILSAMQTRRVQIGIALLLSAGAYLFTQWDRNRDSEAANPERTDIRPASRRVDSAKAA